MPGLEFPLLIPDYGIPWETPAPAYVGVNAIRGIFICMLLHYCNNLKQQIQCQELLRNIQCFARHTKLHFREAFKFVDWKM